MKTIVLILLSASILFKSVEGNVNATLCDPTYHNLLIRKVGKTLPEFADYPFFSYPNQGYESLLSLFPESKVLLFGYGSLINKQSAGRNVKPEALATMQPAAAFCVKRVFNYQASKTDHWGSSQDKKEKAMLNLVPSLDVNSIVNGVVMEVDEEDLASLVKREKGYDLVPVLVASWDDLEANNPNVEIKVAYTFIASNEPRDHTLFTSTQFYPVRGYLHAIREGTQEYGPEFANFWDETTFLADGKTCIKDWDEKTFDGILCAKPVIGA